MERSTILCHAILLIFLANMAVSLVVKPPKSKRSNRQPIIVSFGLHDQENNVAYITSKVNLTCKMNNAEAGIFLKSGVTIREGGRFKYIFEDFGDDGLVVNLQITDVKKEDEGVFTCCAFKAGNLALKTFTLKTVPRPGDLNITSVPGFFSIMVNRGLKQI